MSKKTRYLIGLSIYALGTAAPSAASAQQESPPSAPMPSADQEPAEILVTGSRVIGNGYNAPTPVTVISGATLQQIAPINIADAVNQMPQLSGSVAAANTGLGVSTGTAGANFLNLRDLGIARTLVLLDGRRVVASAASGSIDINTLPTALVRRVDIVTGGASAAYGSDAVSGVVNFVLNTQFTGLKGSLSGSIAENGSRPGFKAELSGGVQFAEGRGRLIASASVIERDGARHRDQKWWGPTTEVLRNPAFVAGSGEFPNILTNEANNNNVTPGSLIRTGAARGTAFGPGGSPYAFVFGATTGGVRNVGGTYNPHDPDPTLLSPLRNRSFFGRAEFDFTDNITAFSQFIYSRATVNEDQAGIYTNGGTVTIRPDNPYIPASVRAVTGANSFTIGTSNGDFGRWGAFTQRTLVTGLAGLEGKFGDSWRWDASYQYGQNRTILRGLNMYDKAKYALAVDAVINPATGAVVCRSTLTDPTNGCQPLNILGTGVATQAAKDYVLGDSYSNTLITQHIAQANLRGQPFSTWAGPVNVAAGAEARWDRIGTEVDAVSAATGWYTANYQPTNGAQNVVEGYGEVSVPLARGHGPMLHSLEVNGAVRRTRYSLSGAVTTWKAGLVYEPWGSDLRIRVSRSRDIRAPNLANLFNQGTVTAGNTYLDPTTNTRYNVLTRSGIGNPALNPELADTTGIGVVLRPAWLQGFSASIDYYNISIKSAIASLTGQQIVDACSSGDSGACTLVTRDTSGLLSEIRTGPLNFASEIKRGIDFDVTYSLPLADLVESWGGTITAHVLATHTKKHTLTNDGVVTTLTRSPTTDPRWRGFATLGYSSDTVKAVATFRYVSGGLMANYTPETLANPYIPAYTYVDGYFSYRINKRNNATLYLKVSNIFDKSPPLTRAVPYSTHPEIYDVLGRVFTAGINFEL